MSGLFNELFFRVLLQRIDFYRMTPSIIKIGDSIAIMSNTSTHRSTLDQVFWTKP